jgi:hypothetical protein
MKPTVVTLAMALTLSGEIWLRAQQSERENIAKASASEENHNARCEATCAMKHSSQNLASLLVWGEGLNLTDEQRTR